MNLCFGEQIWKRPIWLCRVSHAEPGWNVQFALTAIGHQYRQYSFSNCTCFGRKLHTTFLSPFFFFLARYEWEGCALLWIPISGASVGCVESKLFRIRAQVVSHGKWTPPVPGIDEFSLAAIILMKLYWYLIRYGNTMAVNVIYILSSIYCRLWAEIWAFRAIRKWQ